MHPLILFGPFVNKLKWDDDNLKIMITILHMTLTRKLVVIGSGAYVNQIKQMIINPEWWIQ